VAQREKHHKPASRQFTMWHFPLNPASLKCSLHTSRVGPPVRLGDGVVCSAERYRLQDRQDKFNEPSFLRGERLCTGLFTSLRDPSSSPPAWGVREDQLDSKFLWHCFILIVLNVDCCAITTTPIDVYPITFKRVIIAHLFWMLSCTIYGDGQEFLAKSHTRPS